MTKEYKKLIAKYFDEHSFVESNIKSFNNFIEKGMQKIVNETSEIIPTIIPQEVENFKIKLDKIWCEKPVIIEADGSKRDVYPIEARLRKLTYSSPLSLEVAAHIDNVQRESFVTEVGKIPIMLKSKNCHLQSLTRDQLIQHGEDPDDLGGYFILNGNERVLITVEDLAPNKIFINKNATGPSKYTAKIFSERESYRIPHTIEQFKDGIIYLSFTRFRRVPIFAVIKALGLVRDQDITMFISQDRQYDDIFVNLIGLQEIKSEEDALEYLAKKISLTQPKEQRLDKVREQLDKYLLPHLGLSSKDRIFKAYNLCKMIKRYLMISKDGLDQIDKDHYMNKRLKLSGDLLGDLFRVNLRALVQDMLYNFQRLVKRGKFHSIKIIIRDQLLTSRIKSAMATGVWVGGRKGISQNIDRTNDIATTSHLQRVVSLLTSSQENFEARALHATHWGKLCLKKDTNILLADKYSNRSLEKLQNCYNHHEVSTFDIKTKSIVPSKISNYFTSNPKLMGKKVYKLISQSGREIVATQDHPFYTKRGWVEAQNLKIGDYTAIYPSLDNVEQPGLPNLDLGLEIVNEDKIIKDYPKRFKHYIKELKQRELLPLTTNNYKIEIISRLLGHIFSDGHCSKYNLEFYCGSLKDAKQIASDIRSLGFKPSKITKKHTKIKLNNKTVRYKVYTLSKGGSLHALLVSAGAPIGKKTDTKIEVPRWLFKSNLSSKREFLGAFLGGDGSKPRADIRKERKSGIKIQLPYLVLHKKIELKDNIDRFARDIKLLFIDFDIDITRIEIKEDYIRKDGSKMLKCKIVFSNAKSNIMQILTKIGYRYCLQKEKESNYIGEYLRLREITIKQRMILKGKVKKLYQKGIKPKQISDILKINYRVVNGWIYEPYKYKNTRLSQNLLPSYQEWLKNSKIGESGALWQKISSKETQELDDVRDFTTVKDTHSFIANGFITHNCPIETPEGTPIGLRKNLAFMCSITQEDYSEDKIKKVLEAAGLKAL